MTEQTTTDGFTIRIDDMRERRGRLTGLVAVFQGAESKFGRYVRDLEDEGAVRQTAEDIGKAIDRDAGMIYERLWMQIEEAQTALEERPGYTMPPPHKYAESVRYMLDKMSEDGRWLFTRETQACYYFNGVTSTPVNVRSDEIKTVIALKFGRAEDEPGMKHLFTRLTTYPLLPNVGEPVTLRHNSWYDMAHNTLYLDMMEGSILRVTADAEPEVIRNGTDGVLFDPEPVGTPWSYVPGTARRLRKEWIDRMSFSTREDCPFTQGEQRFFFHLWVLSFWFRSQMRARPLAMAYGETGSGKTTALEQTGQLLIGPRFTTNPSPDKDQRRDFETAVVNQRYMVIDNLDYYVPWLEDLLAAISTGSAIKTRVLFENMKLGHYYPDVFMSVSTREPKHRRDDIANRSIFYLFEPVPTERKQDLNDMYNWVEERRDELLSEMVDMAREILKTERPRGGGISFRMTGFALFCKRAALAMDRMVEEGELDMPLDDGYDWHTQMLDSVLAKQEAYQTQYTVEQDPLMTVLPLWVMERDNQGSENWRRWHRSTAMFRAMAALAEREGISWPIKSVQALGQRITSRRSSLETEYVIETKREGAHGGRPGGTYYHIRPLDFEAPADLFS